MSNNFDETFPRPQAGPFGVVREDGDQERVTVLVAAFEGWNDAADAASSVVDHLMSVWNARVVAAIDPEEFYDFQMNRPVVGTDENGHRRLTWPSTTGRRTSSR